MASLTSYADASLELYVSATDGGGKSSVLNALVDVSLLDSLANLPQFTHDLYSFVVAEDTGVSTVIGTVSATAPTGQSVSHAGSLAWCWCACVIAAIPLCMLFSI